MSDTKPVWAIVGASRGIGREFTRQLLSRGDTVIATIRRASTNTLQSQGSDGHDLTVYDCDMLSESSIDSFVQQLKTAGVPRLDYLVLNAGVLKYPNRATEVSYDDFALHLHTNTIGPIICAQRILRSGISVGTICFISSDSGSAQRFREQEDGLAAYGSSKAALNQMLRHMAAELKRKGSDTIVIALHPGEVATDMASFEIPYEIEGGQMTAEESVTGCIKVIQSKGSADSGTFWTWENELSPW